MLAKINKFILLPIFLFLLLCGMTVTSYAAANTGVGRQLDQYLHALQENRNFHGSVLVAQKGKIILNQGYGMADFDKKIPNKPGTTFAIGSVTKQFTAAAILQLAEKGLLMVEDQLSKYLPDFPYGDEITLHQLLTHTSGLVDYTTLPEFLTQTSGGMADFIKIIGEKPLRCQPGEKWEYNNSGYMILGYIIEKVSGESYAGYLENHIFKPLGMKNSGMGYQNGVKKFTANGYAGFLDVTKVDDAYLVSRAYGAGGMYSTTGDLYLWEKALMEGKVVGRKSLDQMFANGYGWFVADTEYGKEVYHSGNTTGFTAETANYLEQDTTILLLVNHFSYSVKTLERNLMSILSGKKVTPPAALKAIKLSEKALDSCAGNYQQADGSRISIAKGKEGLLANIPGMGRLTLQASSATKFFTRAADLEISFVKDKKGAVTGLKLKVDGEESAFQRMGNTKDTGTPIQDTKSMDALAGSYDVGFGYMVVISREKDRLVAQVPGQSKFELLQESELVYTYPALEVKITFEKDAAGKAVSLTICQGDRNLNAKKVK